MGWAIVQGLWETVPSLQETSSNFWWRRHERPAFLVSKWSDLALFALSAAVNTPLRAAHLSVTNTTPILVVEPAMKTL